MPDMITAEEIMGAALEVGIHDDLLEQFLDEFGATDWVRIGNRAYPPFYAYALGRYRVHPDAVARLREALSSIPRVIPEDYDILLNIEGSHPFEPGPTWDIVKWMPCPEWAGWFPGMGNMAVVGFEPYPVYGFPARRDPLSLSDFDFNRLRRNATTMRDGGKGINESLVKNNLRKKAEDHARREAEDLEFAEYYRTMFKRNAEELGI